MTGIKKKVFFFTLIAISNCMVADKKTFFYDNETPKRFFCKKKNCRNFGFASFRAAFWFPADPFRTFELQNSPTTSN